MAKYFGTDGIRMHAEDFTHDFLQSVIVGLFHYHGDQPFSLLIGGDTRESTARILDELSTIATSLGIRCVNIGVFPTPAINFYLKESGLDFAIDVTASHNPASYNGIKIFETINGESAKLCAEGRTAIENALDQPSTLAPSAQPTTPEHRHDEAVSAYLTHLRDYLGACDFNGLKLAMDCANGATSVIAGKLFEEFGASVTLINADQNFGTGINNNCGSTHLEPLAALVQSEKLQFGVAFDGDGDRCMLVDQLGNTVDGDKILALLADYLGLKSFVVTVMTNQGIFNWAAAHQIILEVTDVGDQNVYARMLEQNIKLGGEQSGHIILPYEPMGDGMLTALMLAKLLSELKKPLSALAAAIPTTPQITTNIPATKDAKQALSTPAPQAVIQKYSDFLASRSGRLLVRPSGTEDLIRLTMWGDENTNLEALAAELAKELQEVL